MFRFVHIFQFCPWTLFCWKLVYVIGENITGNFILWSFPRKFPLKCTSFILWIFVLPFTYIFSLLKAQIQTLYAFKLFQPIRWIPSCVLDYKFPETTRFSLTRAVSKANNHCTPNLLKYLPKENVLPQTQLQQTWCLSFESTSIIQTGTFLLSQHTIMQFGNNFTGQSLEGTWDGVVFCR